MHHVEDWIMVGGFSIGCFLVLALVVFTIELVREIIRVFDERRLR